MKSLFLLLLSFGFAYCQDSTKTAKAFEYSSKTVLPGDKDYIRSIKLSTASTLNGYLRLHLEHAFLKKYSAELGVGLATKDMLYVAWSGRGRLLGYENIIKGNDVLESGKKYELTPTYSFAMRRYLQKSYNAVEGFYMGAMIAYRSSKARLTPQELENSLFKDGSFAPMEETIHTERTMTDYLLIGGYQAVNPVSIGASGWFMIDYVAGIGYRTIHGTEVEAVTMRNDPLYTHRAATTDLREQKITFLIDFRLGFIF